MSVTESRLQWNSMEPSPNFRGPMILGVSPYRRIGDPRRILTYSPLSSGQSSPEGNRRSREINPRGGAPQTTRSRSLSPQGRLSPYGIGSIPLHTSRTVVDSEVSSVGSRKSSGETEGGGSGRVSADFAMAMEVLRGRAGAYPHVNGESSGCHVGGGWREEREGLQSEILECRRRIQLISQEALRWEQSRREYDQKIVRLEKQLHEANSPRASSDKLKLQRWSKKKISTVDMLGPTLSHEDMDDPRELIQVFLKSEHQYMTSLGVLDTQYQQPMKMLSVFKPDVLSLQQLQFLFLNCSELLNLHRYLCEELSRVQFLPASVRLDQFFSILERMFPNFSLYNPFLDGSRQEYVQKELRTLRTKQEFVQLLDHCNKGCDGANMEQLLTLPCERLNEYSKLLTMFLSPKLRGISDNSLKRADTLIRFIRKIKYELQDERSDWDHTQEKIKLLQKLDPNFPVPLEIFDSNTRLVKQGPLNQVMAGGREVQRFCVLFSNYMALAETGKHLRILDHGMIPLCGAQLHKTVDIEGQPLTADLKSGRGEDLLAFRVSFVNNESLYFRVAKPNLRKAWVEALDMCIQESHNIQCDAEDIPITQVYPDAGPKIAAASLEKLFQQLTSPHNFQDDFIDVFLMTHLSFTTSRDVLEALINCMQSPGALADPATYISANAVFTFSMESDPIDPERSLNLNAYSDTDQISLNSPIPTRARTCAMSNSTPKKLSSSLRTSISTSDSDVSPHTSAVVENGILQNGWTNGDVNLKIPPGQPRGSSGDSEMDYVQFFRSSRNSSEMDFGDEDSGNEDNADTPRPSLSNSMIFRGPASAKVVGEKTSGKTDSDHCKISETSIEEEDDTAAAGLEESGVHDHRGNVRRQLSISQKINRDLDETAQMLEKLTQSLFPAATAAAEVAGGTQNGSGTAAGVMVVKRVHRDWRKSRQSTVSASISEPDLTQIGLEKSPSPPPTKRGHRQVSIPVPALAGRRPGTPTDKLTNSLSQSANHSASASPSPFLHGPAMMSPSHSSRLVLNSASPNHLAESSLTTSGKHRKNSEKSVMSPFKKRSSVKNDGVRFEGGKKAETPPIPARYGGKRPSLTKSSSAFFPHSAAVVAENGSKQPLQQQKSTVSRSAVGGLKGIWKRNSRKKTALKLESDEWVEVGGASEHQSPSRELPRRLSLRRKNSISGDKQLETVTESCNSTQHPRASFGRTGPVSLVVKIFQVIDCWQDMHFEDFGEDASLTLMLGSFLRGLLATSCSDSSEALMGQKILDDVTRKAANYSTDSSIPVLLSQLYHLEPDLVKHFTWEANQKQPGCRHIDLSRSFSKDSKENILKVIAEQMTLLEFAVYKAVKRRELLNVNWKKPDREEKAPNVYRLIRRTNEMTSWVCTEILSRETSSGRATVIENLIQIALYCYRHNDLHCSLNITIALSSSIIRSLHKTWEEVDKKFRDKLKKLRELSDYQGRCKKLRERLEQTTSEHLQKTGELPAALPYIGAYLDQIYSLEMCTKTYNKDGLVNFTKMTKLADMVGRTLVYQRTRFNFEPRLDIIAYLTSAKRLSENELYELSCQIEPTSKS